LHRCGRRVRSAVPFHRPSRQQQSHNNAQHELFLPRQAIHGSILTKSGNFGKPD